MNKIDISQIPSSEQRNLAKTILAAMERFYSDPKNVQAFEDWKKSQEVKNADQRRTANDNRDNCGGNDGVVVIGSVHRQESIIPKGGDSCLSAANS